VPYFGLGAQTAIIANLVISAVLIIITFFIRKTVAIGFLIGTVWDIIAGYLVLSG
jgi:Na+/H+-translocating membrane pyrophosphatase